jgi:uncharacterized membrane protein YdjX (TVP38/TMEM64 family)
LILSISKHWLKPLLALLVLAALFITVRQLPLNAWLTAFNQQVAAWGWWGVAVFIVVYALAAIAFVPGSVLTLGAGFAFGLVTGMVAVSIASTLGAAGSFLICRQLARDKVRQRFAHNPKVTAVDQAVAEQGWKIVALLRLSPVFPYTGLNYILGLTGIPFAHYALASWAGMLPGTLLYVYIGSFGRTSLEAASSEGNANLWRTVMLGIGLAATFAVTWYVTRIATRAVKQTTPLEESA